MNGKFFIKIPVIAAFLAVLAFSLMPTTIAQTGPTNPSQAASPVMGPQFDDLELMHMPPRQMQSPFSDSVARARMGGHHRPLPTMDKSTGSAPKGGQRAGWELLTGLEGGNLYGPVTDPSNADVATMIQSDWYCLAPVWNTTDGGLTWTKIGQIGSSVMSIFPEYLVASPFGRLFALVEFFDNNTHEDGTTLYFSDDGGVTWTEGTLPPASAYLSWSTICPDPVNSNLVHGKASYIL